MKSMEKKHSMMKTFTELRTKKRWLSRPKIAQSLNYKRRLMSAASIFSHIDSRKPFTTKKETKSRDYWGHPSKLQKSKKSKYNKFRLKVVLVQAWSSHLRFSLPKYKLRFNKWVAGTLPKSPPALHKVFSKHHRSKHPKMHSKEAPSPRKQDRNIVKSHQLNNSRILKIKFSQTVHYSNH